MARNITAHIARGENIVPVAVAADFYAHTNRAAVFTVEVTDWDAHTRLVSGPHTLPVALTIAHAVEESARNQVA